MTEDKSAEKPTQGLIENAQEIDAEKFVKKWLFESTARKTKDSPWGRSYIKDAALIAVAYANHQTRKY